MKIPWFFGTEIRPHHSVSSGDRPTRGSLSSPSGIAPGRGNMLKSLGGCPAVEQRNGDFYGG